MEKNIEETVVRNLRERLFAMRDASWWEDATYVYIKRMEELGSMLPREDLRSLAHWLRFSASNLEITRRELLIEYITGFTRLVINLGSPSESKSDILEGLDAAIKFYSSINETVADLYITKALYLGAVDVETEERERVLKEALAKTIVGSGDHIRLFLSLAQYYTDISEYDRSIELCRQLEMNMQIAAESKYYCRLWTTLGVNYFTSFQDQVLAENYLRKACTYADQYPEDHEVLRVVSTAYHYLARLEEVKGSLNKALDHHIIGQYYLHMCPEDLGAEAFTHLRIAEVLITARAFAHALDHLQLSEHLFSRSKNLGSGWIQLQLGYATYEAAIGNRLAAEETIGKAVQFCRDSRFVRGELLCLGLLLASQVRHFRLLSSVGTLLRIVATAFKGELRRNNIVKLIMKIPVLLPIPIRRIMGMRMNKREKQEIRDYCVCAIHGIVNRERAVVPVDHAGRFRLIQACRSQGKPFDGVNFQV